MVGYRFATARNTVNIMSRSAGPMNAIVLDLFSARFAFAPRQVAEPGALGLLGLGLLALVRARRSRAQTSAE